MSRRMRRLAAAVLVLAFAVQCLAFVRANSQTYDEALTIVSGVLLLRGGPEVNGEHPPLARVLAALPVVLFTHPRIDLDAWVARRESPFGLGRSFLFDSGESHVTLLRLGRAPMVLFAVLMVAATGAFANRVWGPRAGLLALALAAFDPNLVAHGSLASHDGLLSLLMLASTWLLWEFFEHPSLWRLALLGFAMGLSAITKFSGAALALTLGAAMLMQALMRGGVPSVWFDAGSAERGLRALKHALGNLALAFGVALLVIRLAYGSSGYAAYVAGLTAQLAHQAHGHPAYFWGEIGSRGWPAYFPVALLVKSPPLTIALALLSVAAFRRGAPFGGTALTVLLPGALLLLSLVFAHVAIGVRYALPLVPLLIVTASRVATFELPRALLIALSLGLLHHATAAIRVTPHQLAFFSDLVGGPARGARYLADSNLDWGQDLRTLADWQRAHPGELSLAYFGTASIEAHGIVYRPAPNSCPHPPPLPATSTSASAAAASAGSAFGLGGSARQYLAVSEMNRLGVFFFGDPSAYRWLDTRAPIARLGHSILVYDITDDPAAHRSLAALYDRHGPAGYAETERARGDTSQPQR